MKTLLLSLLILVSVSASSQPLVDFCKKNMGKSIGAGRCCDFVAAAMDECYPGWAARFGQEKDHHLCYGEKLKNFSDLRPGDVILMLNIVDDEGHAEPNHVAIVTAVTSPDVIEIVSQSQGDVVATDGVCYSAWIKYTKKFTFRYYRPS